MRRHVARTRPPHTCTKLISDSSATTHRKNSFVAGSQLFRHDARPEIYGGGARVVKVTRSSALNNSNFNLLGATAGGGGGAQAVSLRMSRRTKTGEICPRAYFMASLRDKRGLASLKRARRKNPARGNDSFAFPLWY